MIRTAGVKEARKAFRSFRHLFKDIWLAAFAELVPRSAARIEDLGQRSGLVVPIRNGKGERGVGSGGSVPRKRLHASVLL